MKRRVIIINLILFIAVMACNSVYYGLRFTNISKNVLVLFKGLASFLFVVVNMANGYIGMKALNSKKPCAFQMLLFSGLTIAFIADVVIAYNFIFGAILFAIGHIIFLISFMNLYKPSIKDIIPIIAVIVISVLLLSLIPGLDFGNIAPMIYIYAIIISFMLGKTISNVLSYRNKKNIIILVGAILFYISDFSLVLANFGSGYEIYNILCLYTYYPAQCLLASSVIAYYYEIKAIN